MGLGLLQQGWVVDVVRRLPQGAASRAWGWLARRRRPRSAVVALQRAFARGVGIDMDEAELPLSAYRDLEALFVRRLRPGSRPLDADPAALVSPVDGRVGQHGQLAETTLLQAKGRAYSLAELLGSAADAAPYANGDYVTLYLAPHDYHRVHAPLGGEVACAQAIPGGLLPVFPAALERVDGLFARNERLVTYIDTEAAGRLAVVKVGATLVGRISLAYDQHVWTNDPGTAPRRLRYAPPRLVQRGAELGAFELGSTVVLVAEAGRIAFEVPAEGAAVRMGQRLGRVLAAPRRRRRPPPRSASRS